MIGKTPTEHQMSIFEVALDSFIDMNQELVLLANQIDWEIEESEYGFVDYGLIIVHEKSDLRMIRNFLKGTQGDSINTLMVVAAYSMRHWMNKNALSSFVSWLKAVVEGFENVIFGNDKKSACLYSTLAVAA